MSVPSWVLVAGVGLCLVIVGALATAIYLGTLREPSRPDE